MSIILYLGNIGSGKSAYAVREMLRHSHRSYYSNIKTKNIPNSILLQPDMIFSKIQGITEKAKPEMSLNIDFWKNCKKPISIILDEAHNIMNSRRGMSKQNILITEWLSLLRRVLGSTGSDYGDLVIITQLSRRIDIIAREMAHKVYYFICHFRKSCNRCHYLWCENSEMPEQANECPCCNGYNIRKYNHFLEIKVFSSVEDYELWRFEGVKTYYRNFLVRDIEEVFPKYDTLQWENLFSQEYN